MVARLSAPVQTGPGAHPASYTADTGSFPEVKLPGRGVGHPIPSSGEVKDKSRAIHLLPFGAFMVSSMAKFILSSVEPTRTPCIMLQ